MEDNVDIESLRKNEHEMEEYIKDIQKRNIGCYLNQLKNADCYIKDIKNADNDFKIKHIKNLYQVYNMLYQTKKVLIRNEDFNILDTSMNDFYSYLNYTIVDLREEIYSFIRLLYDEDFDNNKKVENRMNYKKYKDYISFEELSDKFLCLEELCKKFLHYKNI